MIAAAFSSTARFVWSRNRKFFLGCVAVYLVIFIAQQLLTPGQMRGYLPQAIAALRLIPFMLPASLFISTVNAAALQLGSREGHFPRVFFTLPIKAHEMVLPFVVYGVGLAALLWTAGAAISGSRVLIFSPPGTPVESETIAYWLPCMTTSLLVWFQALVWTPFARERARVWLLLTLLLAYTVVLVVFLGGTLTETQVIAGSLLQIPIAFFVAARGVERDRSGVVLAPAVAANPAEQSGTSPAGNRWEKAARKRPLRKLGSGFDAQLWFERQIHRWNGIFIYAPPVLTLLLVTLAEIGGVPNKNPQAFGELARASIGMFFWITLAVGIVSGFQFARFRAATGWQRNEAFTMTPFFAALPVSTGDFVWAKFVAMTTRVLWLSALAVLACVWIAWRAGITNPNAGEILALRQAHGDLTAAAMLATPLLAFFLFLLSAAASLLSLSLAGRARNWMSGINATRYIAAAVGVAIVSAYWNRHKMPPSGLPEIVRALAAMKIATLVVLVVHVGRTGMLSWTRLATILGFWLATFGALLTAALLFVPEGRISLLTLMALLALLSPAVGTVAAPLALQLNRTR